jgi:hypothetical protein
MAVKQTPWSIEYILNPTKSVQLEAVKSDPDVIELIDSPHKEVVDIVEVMNIHGG